MTISRDDVRSCAAKLLLGILLCARGAALRAQVVISPSFQGTCGSNGMTAGTQMMSFSSPQVGASVIKGGDQGVCGPNSVMVQSGFFGFLEGFQDVATALSGQPIVLTVMTPAGVAIVSLPPGSLPAGAVVSMQIPVSVPGPGDGGFSAVADSAIQINGCQMRLPATLSFSYADAAVTGLTPAQFIVARFDVARNAWVPLMSAVDESNQVVRAQSGFSGLYQVMQLAPLSTVSRAKVFPNPLRPAQGHTAMTFVQLPSYSRIRIYTLKGVLVKDLSANASGMASWNGTNQSGAAAASGAYFVFIQGAGEKRTLTVAIER